MFTLRVKLTNLSLYSGFFLVKLQWRIQDFPDGVGGGAPTSKMGAQAYYLAKFFSKTMKMKEFGTRGGGLWHPPP